MRERPESITTLNKSLSEKKPDIYTQWKNVEEIKTKENKKKKSRSKQFSKTSAKLFFSTGVVIFMPSSA